jgi:hypothetical protein
MQQDISRNRTRRSGKAFAGLTLALCMCIAPASAGLLDGAPREAVTTGINDALPVSPSLALYLNGLKPTPTRALSFPAGYFRLRLQSYCLHAGTYEPTKGDGYLLAPLKGDRAGLIGSILQRSFAHPEIEQTDIQELVWGIEAYTPFADYPPDFQQRVRPLLTAGEVSEMGPNRDAVKSAARGLLGALLPSQVTGAISHVETWRRQLTDPSMSFPQLEELAVLRGHAPLGQGSREVPAGPWSYVGGGAYIRFFPESYSTTDVEVFKRPAYRVSLDSIGRVTKLVTEGYSVEATYAQTPDLISFKGVMIRSWRFKTLRLTGPKLGQHALISNRGWVIDSRDVAYSAHGDSVRAASTLVPVQIVASLNWVQIANSGDTVVNGVERVWDAKGKFDAAKDAHEAAGKEPDAKKAGDELTGAEHLAGGLRDAVSGNPYVWIADTYAKVAIVAAGAASVLEGGSKDGADGAGSGSNNWDYGVQLAQPANTAQQRLGVSGRSAE